jgi:hypothetical protein
MINQEKFHTVKTNRKEKFWFHHIRAVNYFSYRYWWLVLLSFFFYLILWFIFCFKTPYNNCANSQLVSQSLQRVNDGLDNCCDCGSKSIYPPAPDCPDRVMVFQVCNSNKAIDDNFEVLLNAVSIGKLDLKSNDEVGSIFIASKNPNIKVVEPDFTCPMSKMNVYFFDPAIVRFGENTIVMENKMKNNNGNEGVIEIRNYLLNGLNLTSPCTVSNLKFSGPTGSNFTNSFNYTKCCQ